MLVRVLGILLLAFSGFVAIYLIYDNNYSARAITGKRNHNNALKLKQGMSYRDVVQIMSYPEDAYPSLDTNEYIVLRYLSNNGDFLNIEVRLDKNNNVVSIFNPE